MGIKQSIEADIKSALLGGEKEKVTILRTLKSVILEAEIAAHKRDEGLSDSEIISLLSKESKKRQDSATLYKSVGEAEREAAELKEQQIINSYLPEQMSDAELSGLVEAAVVELGESVTPQLMGKVIGMVRSKAKGKADGSRIAAAVKAKVETK